MKKKTAPDGTTPSGAEVLSLEREPQRKLDETRQIVLASDLAKRGAATAAGIGRIKLWMIEAVEELGPELRAKPFVGTELRVLEEGKVKVLHSVAPNVWFGPRIAEGTPDGEVRGVAIREYGRVKPVG